MTSESHHLLSTYQFDLPKELIAQHPVSPRDRSRLMVVDRKTGNITDRTFYEILEYLECGDNIIMNDTKVIPARLFGARETGGKCEIFLLKDLEDGTWKVLAQPGKKLVSGSLITFAEDFKAEVLETYSDGSKRVKFICRGNFEQQLQQYGTVPLPHYIKREAPLRGDKEDYQTIYAKNAGAVAAPTAGLHFTHELFNSMENRGIHRTYLTLHVGIGTFKPVQVEDIRQHEMHQEFVSISLETANRLNYQTRSHRNICVGTTCCRALESAVDVEGHIRAGSFETGIFIYPGYEFKYVDTLLTNFHLPGSSLIMLVSAFAGIDLIKEAYAKAVKDRYRFFSYGDAMLIL